MKDGAFSGLELENPGFGARESPVPTRKNWGNAFRLSPVFPETP